MIELEDAEELKKLSMDMVRELKKRKRLIEKDMDDATPRARKNHSANITWQSMDIERLHMRLHAVAVNCGIASPEKDSYYDATVDFYPSPMHHYKVKRPLPRVIKARREAK